MFKRWTHKNQIQEEITKPQEMNKKLKQIEEEIIELQELNQKKKPCNPLSNKRTF